MTDYFELEEARIIDAMMLPRSVMTPNVWACRNPEMVCYRTPIGNPNEYFETNLTPSEAETFAFDLWRAARQARYLAGVNRRRQERAEN